jgi:dynein light chain LC8-type
LEKFNIEKDIAAFIKKEFDKKYNPTWHCIVGKNFITSTQTISNCDMFRKELRLIHHPRD